MAREPNQATHVRYFPNGARIEFRPGWGGGWASRAVTAAGADNWIFFGPSLPKEAIEIEDRGAPAAKLDAEIDDFARGVSAKAAKERTARRARSGVRPGGKRDV
jgi:hypothetical protein